MAAAKSATRQRASRSSGTERQRQRAHHADIAREKATARRKRREGAAGWVADRAGEWSLDGPDWDFFERQKYFWNPLVDYWFRMEVEGWENLPDPPALLVGIHSGAPFVWDAWTVGVHWWRWFGRERPLHGTAHDALMALPGIGAYFRRMGVLPAAPDSIAAALAAGRDVALWPGGERDSLRTWRRRDEAVLAGRTGFVRMAIRSGVPIVPIATIGGADAMPVLASGRRLAEVLQLDRIAQLKLFPIAFQLPWGSPRRSCPTSRSRRRSGRRSSRRSRSIPTPSGPRTNATSRRNTRRSGRPFRREWTASPGAGGCRCSAEKAGRRGRLQHGPTA
jgi:1-acyl-sn-glycerol-3-phosphate acyltransferase